MQQVTKIFGPPGTGKTTRLLNVVDDAIKSGIQPERVAYMAFTKKAADEAASRAIERFKLPREQMLWFRTLHSMAFRSLGVRRDDVMQDSHYKELGYELGFEFTSTDETSLVPAGTALGDKVARIESLSRLRMVSLEQQWDDCNYHDVELAAAKQWNSGVLRYKASRGLIDYTDMLEQFQESLDVDLFILDEAQDLSPLQWRVVESAAANAAHIYLAGDDDQCIYDWAGADPAHFISHPGKVHLLPNSFRIPRLVQQLAQEVVSNITTRQAKQWEPRAADGIVDRVMHEENLDFSKGSWLLLARNRHTLARFEHVVQNQGYPYLKDGRHSTDGPQTRAILAWERWRHGQPIEGKDIRNLSRYLPGLGDWAPKAFTHIKDSPLPESLNSFSWMDVLEIAPRRREYIRSCLANGESLFTKPRITISTIHMAKGGEADHVVLIPDLTQQPWSQINTDSELRVLYVALTRARESLTIVHPNSSRYYRI